MGKKIITVILVVLFLISFSLGIIGLLNKGKKKEEEIKPYDVPVSENVVDYTNIVKQVKDLDKIINNYEFVKANKESVRSSIKAQIVEDRIRVTIPESELEGQIEGDFVNDIIEVPSPVAVQVQMLDNYDVRVYSLSSNGNFYMSMFNGNPDNFISVLTYRYDIGKVESFTSTIGQIDSSTNQIYAIMKTTNGEYYTDYLYETDGFVILTKLVNEQSN